MNARITRRQIAGGAWAWCLPDGTYHREDGPAIERPDGSAWWCQQGRLHRDDGPAIVTPTTAGGEPGTQEWWVNGKRHRTGAPAYVSGDHHEWWVDGLLHREGGPAVMCDGPRGDLRWHVRGTLHRVGGPAIEYADGTLEWYVEGQLHRLDGPARDYVGGVHEWFVRGKRIPQEQVDILDWLRRQKDMETLELVLSSWRPGGPGPGVLLAAITAARL